MIAIMIGALIALAVGSVIMICADKYGQYAMSKEKDKKWKNLHKK